MTPRFNRASDVPRMKRGLTEASYPRGVYPCPSLILPSDTPLTATERGRQGVLIVGTTQRPSDRTRRGFAFRFRTDDQGLGNNSDSNAKRTDAIGGSAPSWGKSSGETTTRRPDTNSTTTMPDRDARPWCFISKASA